MKEFVLLAFSNDQRGPTDVHVDIHQLPLYQFFQINFISKSASYFYFLKGTDVEISVLVDIPYQKQDWPMCNVGLMNQHDL